MLIVMCGLDGAIRQGWMVWMETSKQRWLLPSPEMGRALALAGEITNPWECWISHRLTVYLWKTMCNKSCSKNHLPREHRRKTHREGLGLDVCSRDGPKQNNLLGITADWG